MNFKVILILCAMAATPAWAKDLSLDELRTIQKKMKSTDQLSVEFDQVSYVKMRDRSTSKSGRAQFQKPSKFKWVIEKPVQHAMIYDGKYFYELDPASQTASRYSPTGPRAYDLKQVVDLVLNFDSLLKRYDLVKAEQDGDIVKVQLKPKSDQDITAVDLRFSVKDSLISYLKMTMKNGNHLAHEFKNPVRGGLPTDAFLLPKGVKVSDSK